MALNSHDENHRWSFQTCFFHPDLWGDDPIWRAYFSRLYVPMSRVDSQPHPQVHRASGGWGREGATKHCITKIDGTSWPRWIPSIPFTVYSQHLFSTSFLWQTCFSQRIGICWSKGSHRHGNRHFTWRIFSKKLRSTASSNACTLQPNSESPCQQARHPDHPMYLVHVEFCWRPGDMVWMAGIFFVAKILKKR